MLVVNSTGSASVFRRPLIEALREEGCDVCVITPRGPELSSLLELGVAVELCDVSRFGAGPIENFRYLLAAARAYKRFQPDVVLTYAHKCNLLAGFAARLHGIPRLFLNVTGMGNVFVVPGIKHSILRRLIKLGYWYMAKHSAGLIVQNQRDTDAVRLAVGSMAQRVHHIPGSGINTDRFHPPQEADRLRLRRQYLGVDSDDVLVVLMCARGARAKGVREFYKAALAFTRAWPGKARFVHVGDDEQYSSLGFSEHSLAAAAIAHGVDYLGHVADTLPLIHAADVGCLPSYGEGMSRFLLECLACGLPVITTDAPGCSDMVPDGRNGVVVPVGNSEALVAAVEEVMEADRESMGAISRELALDRFSAEHVTSAVLRLIGVKSP